MNVEEDDEFEQKEEYKQKALKRRSEKEAEFRAAEQIDQLLRQVLDPAAKQRLSNVRLVNPELHQKTTQAILYLVQNRKFSGKFNEEQIKQLLEKLSQKRETKITRK